MTTAVALTDERYTDQRAIRGGTYNGKPKSTGNTNGNGKYKRNKIIFDIKNLLEAETGSREFRKARLLEDEFYVFDDLNIYVDSESAEANITKSLLGVLEDITDSRTDCFEAAISSKLLELYRINKTSFQKLLKLDCR